MLAVVDLYRNDVEKRKEAGEANLQITRMILKEKANPGSILPCMVLFS